MANITVKNIPDDLYERLRSAAKSNRRSINNEIITRLEQSLAVRRVPDAGLLRRIDRFHATFGTESFSVNELDQARREGRR